MTNPEVLVRGIFFLLGVVNLSGAQTSANNSNAVTVHLGIYSRKNDVNTPAFTAALEDMGYSEDVVRRVMNNTRISVLRVVRVGDKYTVMWSLSFCERIPPNATNLIAGNDYRITLCDGRKVTARNEYNPKKKEILRTFQMDGFVATQLVTEISPVGFKVHYKAKTKEANLEFVRDYADDDVDRTIHQGQFFLKPYYDTAKAQALLFELGYDPEIHSTILEDQGISMMRIYKKDVRYTTYWALFLCEEPAFEWDYVMSGEEYYLKLCDGRIVRAKNVYDPKKHELIRIIMMDWLEVTQTASDMSPLGFKVQWETDDKKIDLEFVHTFLFYPSGETIIEGAFTLSRKSINDPSFLAVLHQMGYGPSEVDAVKTSATSVIRIAKEHGSYIAWWSLTICEENLFDGVNLLSGDEYEMILCNGKEVKAVNVYDPEKKQLTRTVKMNGFNAKQVVTEMSPAGLTVHYYAKGKQAKLEFVPYKFVVQ